MKIEGSNILFAASLKKKLMSGLLALVTGAAIIAFFGRAKTIYVGILGLTAIVLIVYFIPQIVKKGEIFVVTEAGFLDKRNRSEFIRWNDVKAVSARKMNFILIAEFTLHSGRKIESSLGNLDSSLDQIEIYDLISKAFEQADL